MAAPAPPPPSDPWFSIDSPWVGGAGATGTDAPGTPLAILRIESTADGIDQILAHLGWRAVDVGSLVIRSARGDEVLLARSSPTSLFLMPLGSPVVVGALAAALESAGCTRRDDADPRARYPEASDHIEACALDAMARAASPLAIDAILRHRDLWSRALQVPLGANPSPLDHLLAPPRVVVIGRPNIGKSSLLNAMARRPVAIASDEPGTTRDHVGAEVACDGLIVRWIDTPGIHPPGADSAGPIDRIAADRARVLVETADLIVFASDASSGSVDPRELPKLNPGVPSLRIALRADLGTPCSPADVTTSARTGLGLPELARCIRRTLVPDSALTAPVRWRFHPFLPDE